MPLPPNDKAEGYGTPPYPRCLIATSYRPIRTSAPEWHGVCERRYLQEWSAESARKMKNEWEGRIFGSLFDVRRLNFDCRKLQNESCGRGWLNNICIAEVAFGTNYFSRKIQVNLFFPLPLHLDWFAFGWWSLFLWIYNNSVCCLFEKVFLKFGRGRTYIIE